mgnify:FL=1
MTEKDGRLPAKKHPFRDVSVNRLRFRFLLVLTIPIFIGDFAKHAINNRDRRALDLLLMFERDDLGSNLPLRSERLSRVFLFWAHDWSLAKV